MTTLIGLTGHLGSGKDTAYIGVQNWATDKGLTVCRRGFADKLKVSALTALGYTFDTVEEFIDEANLLKTHGKVATSIEGGPEDDVYQELKYISGREYLQLYGTEAHREVFGKNFWVDASLPFTGWQDNFDNADLAVVTDVRFDNEALRIKELKGFVYEIVRDSAAGDGHASEAGIDPIYVDTVIDNNSDIPELWDNVGVALDEDLRESFATV